MYTFAVLLMASNMIVCGQPLIVCDGVMFNGMYHDKDLLFEGVGNVYNLVIHPLSNYLFFSQATWNGTTAKFGIMTCHIVKRICRHVPGIAGGYAIGYDRRFDDIYLGGSNGIYKYNFRTKRAVYFAESNKSIWNIFVGKLFYFIEYPTQKLHVFNRGKFRPEVKALKIKMDTFFISKQDKIYFSNITGLYKANETFQRPVVLDKGVQIKEIAQDMFGDVYFGTSNGIYMEDKPYKKIKKVSDITRVNSIAFLNYFTPKRERDQLIYSEGNTVYTLLPSKYSKLCLEATRNDVKPIRHFP